MSHFSVLVCKTERFLTENRKCGNKGNVKICILVHFGCPVTLFSLAMQTFMLCWMFPISHFKRYPSSLCPGTRVPRPPRPPPAIVPWHNSPSPSPTPPRSLPVSVACFAGARSRAAAVAHADDARVRGHGAPARAPRLACRLPPAGAPLWPLGLPCWLACRADRVRSRLGANGRIPLRYTRAHKAARDRKARKGSINIVGRHCESARSWQLVL